MTIPTIINERIEYLRNELNTIKPPVYMQHMPDGGMTYYAIQEELRHWVRLAIDCGMTTEDEAAIRADECRIMVEKANSSPGSPMYQEAFKHMFNEFPSQKAKLPNPLLPPLPPSVISTMVGKLPDSQPKTTGMTFEEAVTAMKAGKKVRRPEWSSGFYFCDHGGFVTDSKGLILGTMPIRDAVATDWEIVQS